MKLNLTILYSFLILLFIYGCGNSLPIVTNPKVDIPNYHTINLESQKKPSSYKKETKVYIDFSNGMHEPINQCYDFIDEIITIVNRRNTKFYRVGLGKPSKVKGNILESKHPKNPRLVSNYTDNESALDGAIEAIIADNQRQSIFITDFELYKDGRFDPSPWATLSFQDWLSQGHQIDVFAKEYKDGNTLRYLYLLLFTPKSYPKEDALITRLKKDGYTDKGGMKYFSFSKTIGNTEKKGRAYSKLIATDQEFEEEQFAYYSFDLLKIQPVLGDEYLFGNVVFKNESQVYSNLTIESKVVDITMDFPNNTKGSIEVDNVFDINIINNKEEYVFGVKLSKELTGLTTPRKLYRIDFYLTDAEHNLPNTMDMVLQWTNANQTTFSSLNKSLQEAVKRIKPDKKLLYTYYVELCI